MCLYTERKVDIFLAVERLSGTRKRCTRATTLRKNTRGSSKSKNDSCTLNYSFFVSLSHTTELHLLLLSLESREVYFNFIRLSRFVTLFCVCSPRVYIILNNNSHGREEHDCDSGRRQSPTHPFALTRRHRRRMAGRFLTLRRRGRAREHAFILVRVRDGLRFVEWRFGSARSSEWKWWRDFILGGV